MTIQEYFLPRSLPEALALAAEYGSSGLITAGGTITMPLINEGATAPDVVIGLRHAGLNRMGVQDGTLLLGATVTVSQVLAQDSIPFLQVAARNVAAWSIRNMATVGGNLFAPPPSGDLAVALLALDAQVRVEGPEGGRVVPLADFYTGSLGPALGEGELVTEITVPIPSGRTSYLKHGRKQYNTPAVVTVAAHVTLEGDRVSEARLALNGAGPHPVRARRAESLLRGQALTRQAIGAAAAAAVDESEPFSDGVASDWYRRRMIGVFVGRALDQIATPEA
jgi:CO/xanthine dehydrogenase FAD-binding subunit